LQQGGSLELDGRTETLAEVSESRPPFRTEAARYFDGDIVVAEDVTRIAMPQRVRPI
jgi:hypothetical protein